jgi:hypothetical protein
MPLQFATEINIDSLSKEACLEWVMEMKQFKPEINIPGPKVLKTLTWLSLIMCISYLSGPINWLYNIFKLINKP